MKSSILLAFAVILAGLSYFISFGPWVNFTVMMKNFGVDFLFLALIPIVFLYFRQGRDLNVLRKYGLALGNWKWWGKWVLVLLLVSLPIMYIGIGLPAFGGFQGFVDYYPKYAPARYFWMDFVLFELAFGIVMFATEFFYRGFLLFGLSEKLDWRVANLIHAFLYMLVHIGKPLFEVPYSFVAGYVFGYVDYKGKSIIPSFLMHWVSSVIFDLFILLGFYYSVF